VAKRDRALVAYEDTLSWGLWRGDCGAHRRPTLRQTGDATRAPGGRLGYFRGVPADLGERHPAAGPMICSGRIEGVGGVLKRAEPGCTRPLETGFAMPPPHPVPLLEHRVSRNLPANTIFKELTYQNLWNKGLGGATRVDAPDTHALDHDRALRIGGQGWDVTDGVVKSEGSRSRRLGSVGFPVLPSFRGAFGTRRSQFPSLTRQ